MIRSKIIIALFFGSVSAAGQFSDAGLWADAGVNFQFSKKWEASVNPEIRFNENISEVSRLFIDAGAQYKVNKSFFAALTYRGGLRRSDDIFEPRQRLQFGLGLKEKWNDFGVTLQSRWQMDLSGVSAETDADLATTMRNKLQVKYTGLKKTDLATSIELFNSTSPYGGFVLQNWRWIAQVERKLDKKQSVTLGYLIQKSLLDSPQEIDYVLLLSYQYTFDFDKKKKSEETPIPTE